MSLISVEEALQAMREHRVDFGTEEVALENATGRILRENILADRDFPPFDRVTKDGIALQYQELATHNRFSIQGIQAAGEPQQELTKPAGCLEVMTGAILPAGTDTVIMYEEVEITAGVAHVNPEKVAKRQNIHFKGMDARAGDVLLHAPAKLTSGHINTLASVGKISVKVARLPRIAIISTGDELVDPDQSPAQHQIRKSNVFALKSLLREEGMKADLYHVHDEQEAVQQKLQQLLEKYDALLITGGVSKGKYDFVPDALQQLGVQKVFHGIKQRPGKPFWFGVKDQKRVFAFPGNPVSTFVCHLLYFREWLGQSINWPLPQVPLQANTKPGLQEFWHHRLVRATWSGPAQAFEVEEIGTSGSGDLVSLNLANGILSVPPATAKEAVRFVPISAQFYDFVSRPQAAVSSR